MVDHILVPVLVHRIMTVIDIETVLQAMTSMTGINTHTIARIHIPDPPAMNVLTDERNIDDPETLKNHQRTKRSLLNWSPK